MTPKQRRFIDEYLIDGNATQAAIRAGYSKRSAMQIGEENLRKPVIAAAVQEGQLELQKRTQVDQDYVIGKIRETVERCAAQGDGFIPAQVLKGCELLGKHLGIFTEIVEHKGDAFSALFESIDGASRGVPAKKPNGTANGHANGHDTAD